MHPGIDCRPVAERVLKSQAGFIPTIDVKENIGLLFHPGAYVVKPKDGADSIGMRLVGPDELERIEFHNTLLQLKIDNRYKVSFYYIDDEIQYALYAPDNNKRWGLTKNPFRVTLRFERG